MESGGSTLIWTVISFGMAALELALGAAIGWWLRGRKPFDPETSPEVQQARAALAKLHDLAASVAADVGQHTTQVQAISDELTSIEGDSDLESAVVGTVAKILQANNQLAQQLATAEVKLQEQAHEIEIRTVYALTDQLTGRANRRAFDHELERRIIEWQRRQTPVSLAMVDIDHFKKFNDTHGHQAGDAVLRGVAEVLHRSMRDMDLVARYGGEEFGIIMPVTPGEAAGPVAERVRAAVAAAIFRFEGTDLKVTVSEGAAQSQPGDTAATLVKRADDALYAAKKAGRNRVYFHDGENLRPVEVGSVPPRTANAPTKPPAAKSNLAAESASFSGQRENKSAPTQASPTPVPANTRAMPLEQPTADVFNTRRDELAEAANREAYARSVRQRVAESNRFGTSLSLMLVQLDDLQSITQLHGPQAVTAVQRAVDQFLTATIREMDTVSRYRENAFAVLLPGTPLTDAARVAERVRRAVAETPLKLGKHELSFTVSVGVVEARHGDDYEALLKRSEATVQAAHDAGRNRTYVCLGGTFEPSEAVLAVS
jgi:diguanylate cyclase